MPHIMIVSGSFYQDLAAELLKGAIAELAAHGVTYEKYHVPGALEIPQVIRYGIATNKYDGFVALGTVIRGETAHYDIVAGESARVLMDLALQYQTPIGNGILTVENDDQAWARADVKRKNKGKDAADAVLSLLKIKNALTI